MNVDWGALGANGCIVEVVEIAAQAVIEDGATCNRQRIVFADGEASGVEGTALEMEIVLELVVGHDFSGALALIGQDAAFEVGVGLGGASGMLQWQSA